jgi:hypothetical protein
MVTLLHVQLDRTRAERPNLQRFALLPDGALLKAMSLGFRNVVADLLWLQAVQAIGERKVTQEAGKWIYRAMDLITTLDPKFVEAYEAGGIALCTVVVMPNESNLILEKGMRNNPKEWSLPFMLGINYYFEFGDDAKAAEYIAKAATIGGGPEYLASFASRLYMTAKEPQKSIDFLAQSYEQASDPQMKGFLEFRLKEALVERDLQMFEKAIEQYRERFGKPPGGLEPLLASGLISALPVEPFGGLYLYDFNTHSVRSTSVERRFQASGHRRPR